ncbi:MAG: DNA-binding domain protein [Erysipelotrichaceae bacterium]|nr:MAG: DNA-binding domain [Erysipelotrichaceae bacterium]TXT17155.1 MAG: DNA-binding domain protein [Erysipelotrichaceae bacterium]
MQELKDIKIGQPAQRALNESGIVSLDQLCNFSEKELLALHGIGPKATRILKEVLQNEGLSFKK